MLSSLNHWGLLWGACPSGETVSLLCAGGWAGLPWSAGSLPVGRGGLCCRRASLTIACSWHEGGRSQVGSWLRMGSCRTGHAGLCSGTHISACHFVQGDWPAHASLLLWVGYAQRHFMLPKQALVPGFPLAPPTFQHPMSRGHQEPSLLWGIALCNLLHFFPSLWTRCPGCPPSWIPSPCSFLKRTSVTSSFAWRVAHPATHLTESIECLRGVSAALRNTKAVRMHVVPFPREPAALST